MREGLGQPTRPFPDTSWDRSGSHRLPRLEGPWQCPPSSLQPLLEPLGADAHLHTGLFPPLPET